MKVQMKHVNQIQDNEGLDPEIKAEVLSAAIDLAKEVLDMLHGHCKMVIEIENFTSNNLRLLRQSEHHNNGNFTESPDSEIEKKSIGSCGSVGGTGVGNKNYVLYDLNGMNLIIYWHNARVGGTTYWMDLGEDDNYREKIHDGHGSKVDKEILDRGKDNQGKNVIRKVARGLVVSSSFGKEVIKVSVLTEAQEDK